MTLDDELKTLADYLGQDSEPTARDLIDRAREESRQLREQLGRLRAAAEECLGGWTDVRRRDALRAELNAQAGRPSV